MIDPRAIQALEAACRERGLHALRMGDGVRAWLKSQAGPWPIPDEAIWVLPGYDPADGSQSWTWDPAQEHGRHPRADIEGTADAVAAYLHTGEKKRP